MSDPVRIRPAAPGDLAAVRALLTRCELPAGDLDLATQRFVLACDGAEVVGSIALEAKGPLALLRSLAVAPSHRGRRLGEALYDRAVALATELRVRELYLLTTTAERFFARRGFVAVDRRGVPAAMAATSEFATVCCSSATCMHLSLGS